MHLNKIVASFLLYQHLYAIVEYRESRTSINIYAVEAWPSVERWYDELVDVILTDLNNLDREERVT